MLTILATMWDNANTPSRWCAAGDVYRGQGRCEVKGTAILRYFNGGGGDSGSANCTNPPVGIVTVKKGQDYWGYRSEDRQRVHDFYARCMPPKPCYCGDGDECWGPGTMCVVKRIGAQNYLNGESIQSTKMQCPGGGRGPIAYYDSGLGWAYPRTSGNKANKLYNRCHLPTYSQCSYYDKGVQSLITEKRHGGPSPNGTIRKYCPPGTYQDSCTSVGMQNGTLSGTCYTYGSRSMVRSTTFAPGHSLSLIHI